MISQVGTLGYYLLLWTKISDFNAIHDNQTSHRIK